MKREFIPGILGLLALFFFARMSPNFLDASYLLSNSTLYVEIGLLALGMTFVIISGNIDLSVASMVALVACITAKMFETGMGTPVVVVSALVMGALLGAMNGVLVAKLALPSFLVTLGTMAAYRGAAQAMMGPQSVALPESFKGIDKIGIAGIPTPLIVLVVLAIVVAVVLHQTVFGRWVFAVGTNESASRYAGVPVDRVKIAVFALTGLMAGIGALLLNSRLAVARHDLARGWELDAITVVVVGGTAIAGGRGGILGSFLALFLITILKTGMGVMNVKAEYQLTAIGILLIVAVFSMNSADSLRQKFSSAGFRRPKMGDGGVVNS